MLSLATVVILLLAGYSRCDECASQYASCQGYLYSATLRLQSGDYSGYCSHLDTYVTCVNTTLDGCDSILYNVTALLKTAEVGRGIYCPSDINPGHVVCYERLATCRVIYSKSRSVLANTTAYCSLLDEYISCVVRDLSPCHQPSFSVTTFTSDLSSNQTCVEGDTCSFRYTRCQDVYVSTTSTRDDRKWEQFCSHADIYLSCTAVLGSSCNIVYSGLLTSSLSRNDVITDRKLYCSDTGPSYYACQAKHDACRSLLVITGSVRTTIIMHYCRSLDRYMKCIAIEMSPCQYERFKVTRLQTEARANFTDICTGINLSAASFRALNWWVFFLLFSLSAVAIYV